jgi:hypothetical protein
VRESTWTIVRGRRGLAADPVDDGSDTLPHDDGEGRLENAPRTSSGAPETETPEPRIPCWGLPEAAYRTRTDDPILTKDVLYQLS